jgi:hypothetical protein
MGVPTLTRLRYDWCLSKGGIDAFCEIWSDGIFYEARLVRSGVLVLRDRAHSEDELRREHRRWLTGLESLGWTRRLAIPVRGRAGGSAVDERAPALKR